MGCQFRDSSTHLPVVAKRCRCPQPWFPSRMNAVDRAIIKSLREARRVVVLTGAGVSAESGVPTFRDKQTGLWERFDAAQLATPSAFQRDPALVWGWYEWRRATVLAAQPNAGHRALAAMADRVPQFTLITQNVDDLHERAGSPHVLHLHGELARPIARRAGDPMSFRSGLPSCRRAARESSRRAVKFVAQRFAPGSCGSARRCLS